MTRVKRGFKARRSRKKILKLAKGFRGSRKNRFRTAIHVVRKGLLYAYRDRRVKKRTFRRLWILRINAAAREYGLKYSTFMSGLKKLGVSMDRSVLAHLAVEDSQAFQELIKQVKTAPA